MIFFSFVHTRKSLIVMCAETTVRLMFIHISFVGSVGCKTKKSQLQSGRLCCALVALDARNSQHISKQHTEEWKCLSENVKVVKFNQPIGRSVSHLVDARATDALNSAVANRVVGL